MDWGKAPAVEATVITVTIVETTRSQIGKMKDIPISKLIITKTGHRSTQYKQMVDTLSILCADKNYQGIDDVIQTGNDPVEADFVPPFPNANQLFTTQHVQISTINPVDPAAANGHNGMLKWTMLIQKSAIKNEYGTVVAPKTCRLY